MAAMRRPGRVAGAAGFVVPLLALLVIWEAAVRAFDVSPRVFPAIEPVAKAGIEATLDGTLIRHIGAIVYATASVPRRRPSATRC